MGKSAWRRLLSLAAPICKMFSPKGRNPCRPKRASRCPPQIEPLEARTLPTSTFQWYYPTDGRWADPQNWLNLGIWNDPETLENEQLGVGVPGQGDEVSFPHFEAPVSSYVVDLGGRHWSTGRIEAQFPGLTFVNGSLTTPGLGVFGGFLFLESDARITATELAVNGADVSLAPGSTLTTTLASLATGMPPSSGSPKDSRVALLSPQFTDPAGAKWETDWLVAGPLADIDIADSAGQAVNRVIVHESLSGFLGGADITIGTQSILEVKNSMSARRIKLEGGFLGIGPNTSGDSSDQSSPRDTLRVRPGGILSAIGPLLPEEGPAMVVDAETVEILHNEKGVTGEVVAWNAGFTGNVKNEGKLRLQAEYPIRVWGDYTQTDKGTLVVEDYQGNQLFPAVPREQLTVKGTARLDGKLKLGYFEDLGNLLLSVRPGQRATLLQYGRLEGRFREFKGTRILLNEDVFIGLNYRVNHLGANDRIELITIETPRLLSGITERLTTDPGQRGTSLLLVTHGTMANADGWVTHLATHMESSTRYGRWDVVAFDWRQYATGPADADPVDRLIPNPFASANNGISIGESLAFWLQEVKLHYQHVHLLSHSSSSWLVDALADKFYEQQDHGETIHLTLFDTFAPTSGIEKPGAALPRLGDSADWAEQIVDSRLASPGTDYGLLLGTNATLKYAFNIDVTDLAPFSFNPLDWHAWPYQWYTQTVIDPHYSADYGRWGFFKSKEYSDSLPSHTGSRGWAKGCRIYLPGEELDCSAGAEAGTKVNDNRLFVAGLYRELLGRPPDEGGLATFLAVVDQARDRAASAVALGFVASAENRSRVVQGYYQAHLGRTGTLEEVNSWLGALQQGMTPESSEEYFQRQGAAADRWLDQVYRDLLGRERDPGSQPFLDALERGAPRHEIASSLLGSPEYRGCLIQAMYARHLQRQGSQGETDFWVQVLEAGTTDEQVLAALLASNEYVRRPDL